MSERAVKGLTAAVCGDGIVSPFDRLMAKVDIMFVVYAVLAAAIISAAVLILIKKSKRRAAERRIEQLMREEEQNILKERKHE